MFLFFSQERANAIAKHFGKSGYKDAPGYATAVDLSGKYKVFGGQVVRFTSRSNTKKGSFGNPYLEHKSIHEDTQLLGEYDPSNFVILMYANGVVPLYHEAEIGCASQYRLSKEQIKKLYAITKHISIYKWRYIDTKHGQNLLRLFPNVGKS